MGQPLENNDTIKLTPAEGFPVVLDIDRHQEEGITLDEVKDQLYDFDKTGFRVYHHTPTRALLVEERDGKWISWGHVQIQEQTHYVDDAGEYRTKGVFKISKIYPPEAQVIITQQTSKEGKSYF